MNEPSAHPQPSPRDAGGENPTVRFDATVHPGPANRDLLGVADLDLDRILDREGEVRVAASAEECRRLLESGYEVHLHAQVPVRPLPAELVEHDDSVKQECPRSGWCQITQTGLS
ncbi:hypothetical protein [Streptomyces sp. ALI-76-A]|jgi:hypothetical protein|uniref:hypothetical protein n=1 Tax=Streptomyces sp. ALI-76-A TaxID=3025736 RepID=UPI00256F006A|nr:hypothetical protein [Streptomyces sp. ALI-76-A]MDL5206061.1 hypothetical protein [Streptomyces sp. ALI-76-A]